jgi:hypothetical protein
LPSKNFATLENTAMEQPKKQRTKSEAVEEKSEMLTVRVLWACHAFNAAPEEGARQVVADLFDLLARGGSVSVHVEEMERQVFACSASDRAAR